MSGEQANRRLGDAAALGTLEARIPVRGDALVHEVNASEQTVIFTRDRCELLLLNDMGAGVWYLLNGRRNVAEIIDIVTAYFPDAEDQVADDVHAFLTTLEGAGALRFG